MIDPSEIAQARRALGRQLADYRRAAGFSQHQLAPHTLYGRSTIANVEIGRQNAPRDFWQRCDRALKTQGALERGHGELERLVARRRREVAGFKSAVTDSGSSSYFRPHDIRSLTHAMLHSPAGHAAPADVSALSRHALRAWQLRQGAFYAELADHLAMLIPAVEHAISSTQGERQRVSLRMAVHTYNAASSLLKRLGGTDLALLAADRAARAAARVDDAILDAAASYRVANVLLSAARLDVSREVALRAADVIAPGRTTTPSGLASWGGLLLTAAVAAARSRDEPLAWELLGEARAASRLLATDYSDMHTIFGPTNVAIHAVQIAVELGDGRCAVRRAERIRLDRLPASLNERRGSSSSTWLTPIRCCVTTPMRSALCGKLSMRRLKRSPTVPRHTG